MSSFLILCDGAQSDGTGFDTTVPLALSGSETNLRATIQGLSHALFQELDPILEDFLRIATFVHAADGAVSRGRERDVYAKKWVRSFSFAIPVFAPDFWNSDRVGSKLTRCLSFLSDDQFRFHFTQKSSPIGQRMFDFQIAGLPQAPGADSVLTVSGGLDSLAGAVQAVKENGLHPVLVGHWSATRLKNRQKTVIEGLREAIPQWSFPWVGMWSSYKGCGAVERSQRCRAFLYLTLAMVCAKQADFAVIGMNDNGITSVNVPHTDATRGAFLTRSTHPRFFHLYRELASELPGSLPAIQNTLLDKTKADVVRLIAKYGCERLIQETTSCFHVVKQTGIQQHCGTCPQCVDRRFATEIAGLSEFDIPERYETEIFTSPLKDGEMRTNAENFVRFAYEVKQMTEDVFIEKYPTIWDCVSQLPDSEVEGSLLNLAKLHIRHSQEVWELVDKKCREYVGKRIEGKLASSSLIGLVFSNEIHSDLQDRYVKTIVRLLSSSVPTAFQHRNAVNETEVQDVGQATFIAAQEHLIREAPMVPFAGVGVKPDFSKAGPAKGYKDHLFIEFKYPKERKAKNRIVSEIMARILAYKKHAAFALFVVYDPNRAISNDEEFRADIEKEERVWVAIMR
jgi:hypothetical protein